MSALTSLLVRDRVVPVSKIEEALQHQVLAGGDIETILLEMNLVPEDVLSAYRAAIYGLLPATREEVMKASRDAIRRVPRELARGAGIVPLWLEGRVLVVAAIEPPNAEVDRQVKSQLGCDLTVRIVTQPRLLAALAHHYGFELDARVRRLTEALRKRDPGVIPYVRPPTPSMKPSMAPRRNPFGDGPDTLEYPVVAEDTPRPEARMPVGLKLSEPALTQGVVDSLEPPPNRGPVSFELDAVPLEPTNAIIPPPPRIVAEELTATAVRASTLPPSSVSGHIARSIRGPISPERAVELLDAASQRDDVLFVLLRYAQQFFDFVALFSLGKEGARGRMAHGAGLSQELMEQVVVPLTGNGLVARAARDKRPLIGDLSATDEERAAAALLGRPSGRPGVAIPIMLSGRAVLLLYGDREGEGVSSEDADAVLAIAAPVGDALRRLILETKTLHRTSAPPARQRSVAPASATHEPSQAPEPVAPVSVVPARVASVVPVDGGASEPPAPVSAPPLSMGPRNQPSDTDRGLEAVDLESVARGSYVERRKETIPLHPAVIEAAVAQPERESLGRLFGVPRAAPPPPLRESLLPPSVHSAGSYSYVAAAVAEETIRPLHREIGPLGLERARDAAEPSPVPEARETNGHAAAPAPEPKPLPAPMIAGPTPVELPRPRPTQPVIASGPVPSVIVDMGDQVNLLVEALTRAEPSEEPVEIAELVRIGEAALPALIQHFPGPLWFDRRAPHKRRPRGRDVSAVARAICAFGEHAAPYVASKVVSGDKDQSFYALMLAGEIVHADLLDAVARRALDPDDELRAVALDVLRAYRALPQFEAVLSALVELSGRPGKDPRRQRFAVEALGELRDQRALRSLLPRLADASEAVVQAAHRALVTLTAQDFGLAQRKWEAWAEQWGAAHRVEWLIESLLHGDEGVRALAGEELKQQTQQYFGYHPALPKRDRELAQRKYREWWEAEGRALFHA